MIILIIIGIISELFINKPDKKIRETETPTKSPVLSITPYPSQTALFHLTKISPAKDEKDVDQNSVITFQFSGFIPKNRLIVTFTPELSGKYVYKESSHEIEYYPTFGLHSQTTYTATVTISNSLFTSPENSTVNGYTWSFTTGEQQGESGGTAEEMRQFEQAQKEAEQAYEERKRKLPFIVYMPYQTDHFQVEISAITDIVTITTYATLKEYHLLYREEALKWIKSTGTKTDNLTIHYIPENP